jgi:hypothetical protein
VSFETLIRSSQRARRRWRSSRSGSWVAGPPLLVLVANAVTRCPSTSVIRSSMLNWMRFRTTIEPDSNDVVDFPSPYVIAGRAAELRFVDFVGAFAGGLPEPRDYSARFEIQLDGVATWLTACEFALRLGHMQHPGAYIAYPNSPASDDDVEKARTAMIELARLQHITLAWAPDVKEM